MMCNCLEEIGAKVHARIMERVPEGAEVSKGFDTGWDGTVLSFTSGKLHVMMTYKLAYRMKKKNGEMAKNLTKTECSVAMSYCPFCGEKQESK